MLLWLVSECLLAGIRVSVGYIKFNVSYYLFLDIGVLNIEIC